MSLLNSRVYPRTIAALFFTLASCTALAAACESTDPSLLEAAPGAMYASARIGGDLVFISGQIGVDTTSQAPAPDFETQMLEALRRLDSVLALAGSDASLILRATVYVTDPANLATMNRLYRAYFEERGAPLPARSLVPGLNFGNAIAFEIDAIAALANCE
ncbi:MAG: RidA family protein [Gammaproteobacteria bacterium]|nr:RidA family protein [Gammaproteobacteria bacterium]MDP2140423.1 RidA family protein [Gammaproteobacteria bacterium]MDP2349462.1 RidA family protein [Gammaproteobacteria bacterium]